MRRMILSITILILNLPLSASAADGFAVENLATGLNQPMDLTALGATGLVVVERCGQINFISFDGQQTEIGSLSGSVNCQGATRGLIGVALPPNVQDDDFLFVYYHVKNKKAQRVSRIPINRNGAAVKLLMNEESPLLDQIPAYVDGHQAGGIRIHSDGSIFIGVGDDGPANSKLAQDLNQLHGKLLRINSDGSIPDNNPLIDKSGGIRKEIFAWGFNQPMSIGLDSENPENIWIGDIAESKYQEVNNCTAGQNYGWPKFEGSKTHPANQNAEMTAPEPLPPIHEYDYANTGKGSVVVGQPYRNKDAKYSFPKWFNGAVPVADFWQYWVKFLVQDEGTWKVKSYEPGPTNIRAMVNGDDGAIYAVSQKAIVRMYWDDESPTAKFVFPKTGYRYSAGEVLEMVGTGDDPEDGVLTTGFKWWVVLRDGNDDIVETKKYDGPTATYTLPDGIDIQGYLNVKLRVFDSVGGSDDADLKIFPVASKVTFDSDPPGIELTIDGEKLTPPVERTYAKDAEVDVSCPVEIYLGEEGNEKLHTFEKWSDGGDREHTFVVPAEDVNLTCNFKLHGPPETPDEGPQVVDYVYTGSDDGKNSSGDDSGCAVTNQPSPTGAAICLLLLLTLFFSRRYRATRQRQQ